MFLKTFLLAFSWPCFGHLMCVCFANEFLGTVGEHSYELFPKLKAKKKKRLLFLARPRNEIILVDINNSQ